MPIIEITPEEDSQLKLRVPDYLKGGRSGGKRVRWGLERLFELVPAKASQAKTEKTAPAHSG